MKSPRTAILLTGATGCIGRRLLTGLLDEDHRLIVLARKRRDRGAATSLSAASRVHAVLQTRGYPAPAPGLAIIDIDLTDIQSTALSTQLDTHLRQLGCERLLLVNLAASQKLDHAGQHFDQRQAIAARNHATNVRGLGRLLTALDRFERGRPHRLLGVVHFSSCHAHGLARGLLPESALSEDGETLNSYERSKREGEALIARWQRGRGRPAPVTVIRPAIVTGPDTAAGFLTWLDALVEPDSAGHTDAERRIDRIARSASQLRIPLIPFPGNPSAHLDLVDMDDVVHYSLQVIRHHLEGTQRPDIRYLQFAHPQAPTLRELIDLTLSALDHPQLAGRVTPLYLSHRLAPLWRGFGLLPRIGRPTQLLYQRTEMLRPYLRRPAQTRFDLQVTERYFTNLGVPYQPRAIDLDYLQELLHARHGGDDRHRLKLEPFSGRGHVAR